MSEVVERAARAAHEKSLELARKFGACYRPWDDLPTEAKAHVIECQRAAIEAMRKPTKAMLKAPAAPEDRRSVNNGGGGDTVDNFLDNWTAAAVWRAMIDELLRG